jgi:hypothetical protein
VVI